MLIVLAEQVQAIYDSQPLRVAATCVVELQPVRQVRVEVSEDRSKSRAASEVENG